MSCIIHSGPMCLQLSHTPGLKQSLRFRANIVINTIYNYDFHVASKKVKVAGLSWPFLDYTDLLKMKIAVLRYTK